MHTLALVKAAVVEQAAVWGSADKGAHAAAPVRSGGNADRSSYGPLLTLLPPDKLTVIVMHEALNLLLHAGGSARAVSMCVRVSEAVQTEVAMARLKHKDRREWGKLAAQMQPGAGGGGPDSPLAGDGASGGASGNASVGQLRNMVRKRARRLLADGRLEPRDRHEARRRAAPPHGRVLPRHHHARGAHPRRAEGGGGGRNGGGGRGGRRRGRVRAECEHSAARARGGGGGVRRD